MASKQRTGRGVGGRAGKRYELTDEGWARIEPLMPRQGPGGQWNDHRTTLNGIFWILNSGAQWRDMPERYGKCKSVYDRYRRWTREGMFDQILQRLHVQLDKDGRIDWSVFDVDGSNIRAHRSAAGASKASKNRADEPADSALGRSRGGFGTKLHLVTDGRGTPLGATVTAGQSHESKSFERLMDTVRIRRRRRPEAVAGDKGYSYPRIRDWLRRRGIEAVIPARSDQPRRRLNRRVYRRRNAVERCIGWLKECRRVATRYEKLATHYLAFVKLAMIQRCLRLLEPSGRT